MTTNIATSGEPLALNIHETARMLSCSTTTIRKFIRQKRLPRIEGVRKVLVPRTALESFISTATA